MNKTFIQYPVSGYTPVEHVKLPSREQWELLRDALLEWGDLNAAAACDNLIDILWHVANTAENVEVVSNPLTNGSVRYSETVDVTKNFNGIKATATATWAERHLNKEVSDE